MIRVLVQPVTRICRWRRGSRTPTAGVGPSERIDPRDTLNNRGDLVRIMEKAFSFIEPVELVIHDRYGNVEERRRLR